MDNIFQQIWDADMAGNGVPALRPGEPKYDDVGYVVVDEPVDNDNIPRDFRVLSEVVIPKRKRETYDLCIALLDNYALERDIPEDLRWEERTEETSFIMAVLKTPVMKLVQEVLKIPEEFMAATIRECWFTMCKAGTSEEAQKEASGFEHCFVGEQAKDRGGIGGYHYWHKYFIDDGGAVAEGVSGVDRMVYLAANYGSDARTRAGVLIPEVVTLNMQWTAPAGDGGEGRTLTKVPFGGFFVGCSPEGLMALGMVSLHLKKYTAVINGAEYDLALHRLTHHSRSIRSFYPKFKKAHVIGIGNGGEPPVQGGAQDDAGGDDVVAGGPFRITAAMVNPKNPEGGREYLQIMNRSQKVENLLGWTVTAPNGMRFTLAERDVAPGETFRFTFPSNHGVLRNSGGTIALRRPDGGLAQTCNYTARDGGREDALVYF